MADNRNSKAQAIVGLVLLAVIGMLIAHKGLRPHDQIPPAEMPVVATNTSVTNTSETEAALNRLGFSMTNSIKISVK